MKAFIVEDAPVVRDRLVEMLQEIHGVDVVGLADGADLAIAGIRRLQPDAVILDLQLAQGSGLDVLRAIKPQCPAPIFIVLTNFADPPYRKKCLDAGAHYFFDKSTEFDQVIQVVKERLKK